MLRGGERAKAGDPEPSSAPAGGGTVEQAGELRSARVESLRALAALGVLIGHVYGTTQGYDPLQILGSYGDRFLLGGGFGVYLFFALSGYLIYWPFARRDFGGGASMDLKRYGLNRAVRILPLYWVSVIVVLLWQADGGTFSEWWRFMFLAENYFHETVGQINGVLWSVVVEVWFYATLPMIAWGISRIAGGSRRRAALAIAGLGVASFLVWYLQVVQYPQDQIWRHQYVTTFFFFTGGMLLAILRTAWQQALPDWLRGPIANRDIWLLAAIPFWLVIVWRYQYTWLSVVPSTLMVGACVLPLRDGILVRALDWRVLALVGVASYSLYIWHVPVLNELFTMSWVPSGVAGFAIVAIPICLAIAAVSYLVIERPFLRLRRRWSSASAETEDRGDDRAPRSSEPSPGAARP